jgi:hypothetical protein
MQSLLAAAWAAKLRKYPSHEGRVRRASVVHVFMGAECIGWQRGLQLGV